MYEVFYIKSQERYETNIKSISFSNLIMIRQTQTEDRNTWPGLFKIVIETSKI